ncbi:MAG: acyl-ACP--UDP-N-acetylglucosamine O-acyltransferase [Muribaculaceae bacterium]|nr:acyl-ACP--UDP-N-acetylglucosamine O-acyltransferase [Muribaculaceae bacterium]
MNNISPLAFVHPEAKLGDNIMVGAFVYIDRNVEIGDNCFIHSHTSILSGARIGKNVRIYEGSIIAATPQDFRWKGEESFVEIGDDARIREHVIINRSIHEGKATKIGNGTCIMAQSHVGHDTQIGNQCVLGNGVKIAGDCKIGDCCIFSSGSLVHEGYEVGDFVLVKGGCRVTGNVPPYVVMAHNPISYFGVNSYILGHSGMSDEKIDDIAKCYRHIYQSNIALHNACKRICEDVEDSVERRNILNFLKRNKYDIAAKLSFEDFE